MKRGKRILAIVLSLSMLFVALPIHELQARTIEVPTTQEVELFSDDFNSYGGTDVTVNKTAMIAKGWNADDTTVGYNTGTTYSIPHNVNANLVLSNLQEASQWTDYVVEATLKLESEPTTAGKTVAGIAGRVQDASGVKKGYDLIVYKSKLDSESNTSAQLRLRCDGTALKSASVDSLPVNTDFTLKLKFEGTVIKGYLNGVEMISHDTANDATKYASGYAGLRRQDKTGYTTTFDNFRVYTTQTVNQQEEVLYSLNGTAYSENGSAEDTSCLYYDTFAVEDGYTEAKGSVTNTNKNPAIYNTTSLNLEVGKYANHQRTVFNGIADATGLENYTISADFDFIYAGENNWSGGIAAHCTTAGVGYEFTVYNGKIRLRDRINSSTGVVFQGEEIGYYFSDYVEGDVIGLSLTIVTNADDSVSMIGTMTYGGVEKLICNYTDSGETKCTAGVPALIGYNQSAETVCTVDNILVEAVEGDINSVLVEKFGLVSNVILNIGADKTQRNFNWQTNLDLDCKLQYGLKSDMVEGAFPTTYTEVAASKDNETAGGTVAHKATISNLTDNTEYVYRIASGELASDLYYFSTGDMADGFTFAFAGDPQVGRTDMENDEEGWEATVDAIVNQNVDFMLSSGDQVHSNDVSSYNKFFYNKLAGLTTATIVGNHDNHAMYNDYFNMPNVSEQYGASEAEGDYYFVYGNTLFMCLNTNNLHADTPNKSLDDDGVEDLTDQVKEYNKEAVQKHVDFMTEVVEAHPDVIWKTVVFHQSIYSVSGHRDDLYVTEIKETLEPALIDLDIDVVLMGHDHCYARTYMMNDIDTPDNANGVQSSVLNSNGILYITADSASGNKYGAVAKEDYAAVTSVSTMGNRRPTFSVMNVTNNSYEIITYYSDDLTELDRFTINKNVDVNNDGWSKSDDIVEMRKILVGSSTIDEFDFNGDGVYDVVDLVALKKYTRK